METTWIEKIRKDVDEVLASVNSRAEEVKLNFNSFREVFGKEFEHQAENFKVYRKRLESKGKKIVDLNSMRDDIREEIGFAVSDIKSGFDRIMDGLKERIEKAK